MSDAPPTPIEAPAAEGPRFVHQPLARLYCFLVLSFGLYSLWWFVRAGRVSRARLGRGPAPGWWAVGALVGLVGAIALHRLGERARASAAEHGVHGPGGHAAAAALYLVVSVAQTVGPDWLGLALVPLMPIPFLVVQRQMNAAWLREPVAAPPLRWRWAALAAGAAVWAAIGVFTWPQLRARLADRLPTGALVTGSAAPYTLAVPGPRWVRVPPGTLVDEAADLELHAVGRDSWLASYVHEPGSIGFDELVDARLATIDESMDLVGVTETRSFLDEASLAPFSLASYEVRPLTGPALFWVATVELDEALVEVVGYTAREDGLPEELRVFVASLRGVERKAP